jgi:hypothetical protein
MSSGEMAYLGMALGGFFLFIVVLAAVVNDYVRRRNREHLSAAE